MSAQAQLHQKFMPDKIDAPRTNKQKLRNDLITFLTDKGCKWRSSEVSSFGINFMSALTDMLWEIDGRHHVFSNQGYSIPSIFSKFTEYNQPETSKHRKRELSNLSVAVLESVSSHLFQCLQGGYWERDACWASLKVDVVKCLPSL